MLKSQACWHRPALRATALFIIDPIKVVRLALQNAASAATLLLLSEARLTEVREEKEQHAPALPE
jgi:chaperonin GroEL (HSP60 family)